MDYGGIVLLVLFLKGCVLASMADDYRNITCIVRLYDLEGHTFSSDKEIFKLICPPNCANYGYHVYGTGPYLGRSSICRAAVHSGKLGNKGGCIRIETIKGFVAAFNGASTNNGVESEGANWLGSGGFKVLEKETSIGMSTNTLSPSPSFQTTENDSSSSTLIIRPTSSLITTTLISQKASTTRSTKSATSALQRNTETERQRSTQRPIEATSSMTRATLQDSHLGDVGKPDDVTKTNPTSTSMRVMSNTSQRLLSGLEVTDGVVVTYNVFEKTVEKVSLVLMFVVGVVFGTAFVILRKKRRNIWRRWRRKRQRRNCDSKDDEALCVCYQTLDASMQGLLYDPDTCVRPCSKKQQEAQDFKLETKPSLKKQEICYEDECRDKCSGTCNPEMFEF